MKIAAISDIHSNLTALQAVMADVERFRPDVILVVGDMINRGPLPLPCWEIISDRVAMEGWLLLQGNHEEYVLDHLEPEVQHRPATYYTLDRMGKERVEALKSLPYARVVVGPDGSQVHAYHASIHDSRDGIYPQTTDAALRRKVDPAAAVFVTAHTHRPLIRRLDEMIVVNCGAVGAPFDGDVRASYAQLIWRAGQWQAEIARVPYDRVQTGASYHYTGFIYVEPVAQIHYYEWYYALPLYPYWYREFVPRMEAGEMTAEAALPAFLQWIGLPDTHLVPL